MLTSLRKSSSVSSFSIACFRLHRFSFIFCLNDFLVSGCTRGFAYLLFLPRGMGIGLVCTRRFSFNEFYIFLLFNFLIFICFGRLFFTHDIYPHPHPRPTTHDPHGPSIKCFISSILFRSWWYAFHRQCKQPSSFWTKNTFSDPHFEGSSTIRQILSPLLLTGIWCQIVLFWIPPLEHSNVSLRLHPYSPLN